MFNKKQDNLYKCIFDMGKLIQTFKLNAEDNKAFDFNCDREEFLRDGYKGTELITM